MGKAVKGEDSPNSQLTLKSLSTTEDSSANSSTAQTAGPACYLPTFDKDMKALTLDYKPQDYSITEGYTEIQTLCEIPLAPTVISLAVEDESNQTVVKKSILKKKLFSNTSHESAKQEATIQS